jgi:flagellar basal body-associated protein FliL
MKSDRSVLGGCLAAFWEAASGLERILYAIIGAILLALIAGTALGLLRGPGRGNSAPLGTELGSGLYQFDRIGLLRVKTADKKAAILVIRPVILAETGGRAGEEELIAKRSKLAQAVREAVKDLKKEDLGPAFEGRLKAELKDRFQALLAVAKVNQVLLTDYSILD